MVAPKFWAKRGISRLAIRLKSLDTRLRAHTLQFSGMPSLGYQSMMCRPQLNMSLLNRLQKAILIPSWSAKRSGENIEVTADVEWTFPLEFVEVVWGDGKNIDRKVVSMTDRAPFGKEQFKLTIPATGKKWVRFAAWDSAVNGAFVQPVHFQ